MDEPVFFGTAFEGLFHKGLKGQVDAELAQALLAEGFDVSKPVLPAYPVAVWQGCVRVTARHLYPTLALDAAVREIGTTFLRGFLQTLVGTAVFTLGKAIGVERTLMRMGHNSRSNSNVYAAEVKKIGPGHFELHNFLAPVFVGRVAPLEVTQARFLEGVVLGIFEGLGTTPLEVRLDLVDPVRHLTITQMRWAP